MIKYFLMPLISGAVICGLIATVVMPIYQAHADITFTNLPMPIITPPSGATNTSTSGISYLSTTTPTTTSLSTGSSTLTSTSTTGSSLATSTTATSTEISTSTLNTSVATSSAVLASSWQTASTTLPGTSNTFYAQFISPLGPSPALVDLELFDQDGNKIIQQSWDNVTIPEAPLNTIGTSTPIFQVNQNSASTSLPLISLTPISSSSTATSSSTTTPIITSQTGTTTATTTTATSTNPEPGLFILQSPANLTPGVYTWKAGIFNPGWNGAIQWYDHARTFWVLGTTTASTTETVMPGGVWQLSKTVHAGSTNYLNATFTNGDKPSTVLLAISLLDSHDHEIVTRTWDYTTLDLWNNITEGLTSPPLPPGTYHWAVGIFAPGGTQLYTWDDNIESFTVTPD